ncbi:MAG: hypothetical protein ACP5HG_03020 [Anaerolineae bacterium]
MHRARGRAHGRGGEGNRDDGYQQEFLEDADKTGTSVRKTLLRRLEQHVTSTDL